MKIVADSNIPGVTAAFASFGAVTCVHGREMTREHLRDAEVALVRSITRVGPELLDGTPVRFLGSAAAGDDHLDREYLASRGVVVASAAGSNADSVAEYVISALVALGPFFYQGRTMGVIGVGNVGTRVVAKTKALGMEVLQNDPPLERETGWKNFIDLPTLLQHSDVVTCHVPLTTSGTDPTFHLLNASTLAFMQPHAILINTSRGAVVDTAALLAALQRKRVAGAVPDVWEEEPRANLDLMRAVTFATPHIAGHSLDGKVKGTRMIYEGACRYFQKEPTWDPESVLPSSDDLCVTFKEGMDESAMIAAAVQAVYDVRRDDHAFRMIWGLSDDDRAEAFERLRREYPVRREFSKAVVRVPRSEERVLSILRGLGFQVEQV